MLEIRHIDVRDPLSTRAAYNELFQTKGILLRDSFYLWLIHLLDPQPSRILVDISCGQGRLAVLAQERGLQAIGIDFAVHGIQKGRADSSQPGWIVGDGECLPMKDQCADYITHIGSLEHYIHLDLGAREIARVLKPEGLACILLPNAFSLLGNIRHVCSTGEIFDDGQPLQRYATLQTWKKLLINNGLQIKKTIGYNEIESPRSLQDVLWMLRHPQKVIRLLLSKIIPLNLSNHLVFICSRAQ